MKCPNVSEKVRQQSIRAAKAGHFTKKQDDNSTIRTKTTKSTIMRSAPKKGAAFAEVEEEDNSKGEEEALPFPTYENFFVRME